MALLLNHLRLVHKNDARFSVQCGSGGCTYTARTFDALYSHIYRKHPHCGVIRKRGSSNMAVETSSELGPSVKTMSRMYSMNSQKFLVGIY